MRIEKKKKKKEEKEKERKRKKEKEEERKSKGTIDGMSRIRKETLRSASFLVTCHFGSPLTRLNGRVRVQRYRDDRAIFPRGDGCCSSSGCGRGDGGDGGHGCGEMQGCRSGSGLPDRPLSHSWVG